MAQHSYPKDTAGRLMVTRIPTVSDSATVGDIKKMLTESVSEFETINYVYITGTEGNLLGVISVRELFTHSSDTEAITLSPSQLVTTHPYTDQEHVVNLSLKHNIKAVPVVDRAGILLGVVPSDIILHILNKESAEDVLRFAGSRSPEDPVRHLSQMNVFSHFTKRMPWLVVGLLGGVFAAFVVSFFENILAEHIIFISFIPAVVYMADAVGSQTQMIFVRSLSLEHTLKMRLYVWRELRVNILLALALGSLMFVLSLLWLGTFLVSFILGMSIALTITISMSIAIGLPWILHKMKYDPAVASGPLATVLRDVISLLVYFAVIIFFVV